MFRGRRPVRPPTETMLEPVAEPGIPPADVIAPPVPPAAPVAAAVVEPDSWTAQFIATKKTQEESGPETPADKPVPAERKAKAERPKPEDRPADKHRERPDKPERFHRERPDRPPHHAGKSDKEIKKMAEDAARADVDAQLAEELAGLDESLLYADHSTEESSPAATAAETPAEQPSEDDDYRYRREERIQLRSGKVIQVASDGIYFDFGSKTQGYASLEMWEGPMPAVGDTCEVEIKEFDKGNNLLLCSTMGAAVRANWNSLREGQVVEVRVVAVNKGGLEVEFNGIKGFMPAGQVSLERMEDFDPLIGKTLRAKVLEIRRRERSAVLSAKSIQIEERAEARKKLLAELAEGQTREGTVRQLMIFGAFVDLGGLDGLIHISDLSYSRIKDPSEVVKVGDKVTVKVLKIDLDHTDKRGEPRISLGLKQILTDPWELIGQQIFEGVETTGKVTRLAAFGAFCELIPGVEGLIPISEMSYLQRIRHPSDIVKEGEMVRVKVLSMDLEKRRISLSLKQLSADPWSLAPARYPEGSIQTGKVLRMAAFGAFVELEPGVEGMVHISELSHDRVRSVGDVVREGQEVKCKVLEVDVERKRISLSIKDAVEPPPTPLITMPVRPVPRTPLITPPAASVPAAPTQPAKERKVRRGGLSF